MEKNIKEKKKKVLTEDDLMKYEIAKELGLMEKVEELGWKSLSAKETGRIGGLMTKRKREMKKKAE
ncbi:small acid-soluble spore protein alpha/beta type [Natranaerovirga pectinivora]|uniref:Small acid-soluble spore protein alpha/beta type n=1 Tax=Natranaerovirga pectinivora TaxID=682400 RepID=A0A4V2V070_9FIRM|nr:small, acid-soluble spore protein, alpha/beta type [Natranaerovirga pectinivora]TCT14338.1 small acid-soluble spore protein alpha/beta type [Natranaerovirga pectinivora]